jgi:hypothetical protein
MLNVHICSNKNISSCCEKTSVISEISKTEWFSHTWANNERPLSYYSPILLRIDQQRALSVAKYSTKEFTNSLLWLLNKGLHWTYLVHSWSSMQAFIHCKKGQVKVRPWYFATQWVAGNTPPPSCGPASRITQAGNRRFSSGTAISIHLSVLHTVYIFM